MAFMTKVVQDVFTGETINGNTGGYRVESHVITPPQGSQSLTVSFPLTDFPGLTQTQGQTVISGTDVYVTWPYIYGGSITAEGTDTSGAFVLPVNKTTLIYTIWQEYFYAIGVRPAGNTFNSFSSVTSTSRKLKDTARSFIIGKSTVREIQTPSIYADKLRAVFGATSNSVGVVYPQGIAQLAITADYESPGDWNNSLNDLTSPFAYGLLEEYNSFYGTGGTRVDVTTPSAFGFLNNHGQYNYTNDYYPTWEYIKNKYAPAAPSTWLYATTKPDNEDTRTWPIISNPPLDYTFSYNSIYNSEISLNQKQNPKSDLAINNTVLMSYLALPPSSLLVTHPLEAWDWGNPTYCRQQLYALGFTAADLTP